MKSYISFITIILSLQSNAQGFKEVAESQSNICFTNLLNENDSLNGLTYLYLYNGGGVSVGDINNDGLDDIYFTGNLVEDKLYLNQGGLKFKDATNKYFGKKPSNGFHTGVTMVDINNDGWLDIYISVAGPSSIGSDRANLLYINNKGKSFTEKAAEYGLADTLNTTQAVFFDYDLDGDLDVYVLNHIKSCTNMQEHFPNQNTIKIEGNDHFYINNNGNYVESSKKIGINSTRYGLGIAVNDFNQDGYPDIYVTNDFDYPDKFFINQKDGTYKEKVKELTGHISIFAMGIDAGDINNDGLPDLITVDMASEDHIRSKKNMGGMSTKNFWSMVDRGKHYQYMFNSLQLNLGNGQFTEIASMAGVSSTDWSWSPLFADFDNDGFQDLFISNGFHRDVRDNDFKIKYDNELKYGREKWTFEQFKDIIPTTKLQNYIFKNNGDLTFSKKSFEWGITKEINVNGAIYADLDNDGDLDIIMNATDERSYIMENIMDNNSNYIEIKLTGKNNNIESIGSKIELISNKEKQFRDLYKVRGFQSSTSNKLHFGLGKNSIIDTLIITWNKNEYTILTNIKVNQILKIDYNSSIIKQTTETKKNQNIFTETNIIGISNYKCEELAINDFNKEVLLPHKMSELGPFISVKDINNDGLEDILIGASRVYPTKILKQNIDGTFSNIDFPDILKDKMHEDMQSIFFDFDNDGDDDLYIVSGGNESPINHNSLQDRLYINNNGNFEKSTTVLPEINISGQKVIAKDINNDNWIDLIIFGRQVPGAYPTTPKTTILLNNNGTFVDKTKQISSELEYIGMVTDAIFTDYDKDGDDDLICVGEWMPITVFNNNNGNFTNHTQKLNLQHTVGWWSSIKEISVKSKKTYLLGNIGKNNKYHPSPTKPLQIYMNDFDKNGTNDIVLAKYQNNICYPVRGRQCSSEQMPFIVNKFPTYDQYASADLNSIYTKEMLDASVHFSATIFENSILEFSNNSPTLTPLTNQMQTGCINTILEQDINNDGIMDYLLLGNKFEAEVETIRYDGNLGYVMLGNKDGGFSFLSNKQSGLYLNSNVKDASFINIKGEKHLIVASTKALLKIYRIK